MKVALVILHVTYNCCLCRWERENVSELRPPTGLLFIPQVIYVCVELWWNDIDSGKPKNSVKNPTHVSKCSYVLVIKNVR
jgi:hypothetical protein